MIKKYVRITREGMSGYIQPLDELATALDGEFDGAQSGDEITLELVEMEESEYEALPEFEGW